MPSECLYCTHINLVGKKIKWGRKREGKMEGKREWKRYGREKGRENGWEGMKEKGKGMKGKGKGKGREILIFFPREREGKA